MRELKRSIAHSWMADGVRHPNRKDKLVYSSKKGWYYTSFFALHWREYVR